MTITDTDLDLDAELPEVPATFTRAHTRRRRSYAPPAQLRLTTRGYAGIGGGRWGIVPAPAIHIASSVQVCGLWPFPVSAPWSTHGVPLGVDIDSSSHVCCDPFAWFQAGIINVPSISVFGLPGHGKSSFAGRVIIGLADRGIPTLVLGDLKPDFAGIIGSPETEDGLGGHVLTVGPGKGGFNPLDLGALREAAMLIGGEVGEQLLIMAREKSAQLMTVLAAIIRGKALKDYEETVLSVAIGIAHELHPRPNLTQLAEVVATAHPALLHASVTYSDKAYLKFTAPLLRTLRAMLNGAMGDVFGADTTTAFPLENPGGMCVDISGLNKAPKKLLAAVMVATWTHGFLSVDAHWELAKAGLTQWRGFLIVQDELWKAIGAAPGMVELIDQLSRTNRAEGVGEIKISHSPKDALALPNKADRITAEGFPERAGMVVLFGLTRRDLRHLHNTAIVLSEKEIAMVASWRSPRSLRTTARRLGRPKPPPGAGKALLKVSGAAGIPTRIILTEAEHRLHDTNERWNT